MNNENSLRAAQFGGLFATGFVTSMLGPILPNLRQDLGLSLSQSGYIISSLGAGSIATVILALFVIEKMNRKTIITFSSWMIVFSLVGSVFVHTFLPLFLLGILRGFGNGLCQVGIQAVESEKTGPGRGSAMGLLHFFFSIGSAVSPIVATPLSGFSAGWRVVFLLGTLPSLFVIWRIRAVPSERLKPEVRIKRGNSWKILTGPLPWTMAIVAFSYVSLEVSLYGWLPSFWEAAAPGSIIPAAGITLFFAFAIAAGRITSGRIADRLGIARHLVVCAVGTVLVSAVWVISPGRAVTPLFTVGIGLMFAGVFPTNMALAASEYPEAAAFLTNLILVFASSGAFFYPAFVGELAEKQGIMSIPPAILAGSFLLLAASITAWYLKKRRSTAHR
jgi:MFS family permease